MAAGPQGVVRLRIPEPAPSAKLNGVGPHAMHGSSPGLGRMTGYVPAADPFREDRSLEPSKKREAYTPGKLTEVCGLPTLRAQFTVLLPWKAWTPDTSKSMGTAGWCSSGPTALAFGSVRSDRQSYSSRPPDFVRSCRIPPPVSEVYFKEINHRFRTWPFPPKSQRFGPDKTTCPGCLLPNPRPDISLRANPNPSFSSFLFT